MTEKEITIRAKDYVDKLANGINPITDMPVTENDCVNNIRISRCLFYVSDLLRQVIANGGVVRRGSNKRPFSITEEELTNFNYSHTPLYLSEIVRRINTLTNTSNMKKLSYNDVMNYLIDEGYMEYAIQDDGKRCKQPTAKGREIGIWQETKESKYGKSSYIAITYDSNAQEFIIINMPSILARLSENTQPQEEDKKPA